MSDLYYIQNKGYCGDCLLWWRDGGHGYTIDLNKAWKVPKAKAIDLCRSRPFEDFAWSVDEIDKVAERHINSENMPKNVKPLERVSSDGR